MFLPAKECSDTTFTFFVVFDSFYLHIWKCDPQERVKLNIPFSCKMAGLLLFSSFFFFASVYYLDNPLKPLYFGCILKTGVGYKTYLFSIPQVISETQPHQMAVSLIRQFTLHAIMTDKITSYSPTWYNHIRSAIASLALGTIFAIFGAHKIACRKIDSVNLGVGVFGVMGKC